MGLVRVAFKATAHRLRSKDASQSDHLSEHAATTLFAAVSVIALLGATVLWLSTRWGIGLSPDSVVYVSAARSLLGGSGFSVPSYSGPFIPIVQYPPLFSSCLAALGVLGLDPLAGARWLNVFLFAANIALAGFMVRLATQSFGASIVGSIVAALSFPFVQIHSMAWSEPLFVFCSFLGLALLAYHLETRRPRLLIASALLVGLGFLTRYAGAATVVAATTGIVLLGRATMRQRMVDAGIFCLTSCSPISLWMIRNFAVVATPTGRSAGFHLPSWDHLAMTLKTVFSWFVPATIYVSRFSVGVSLILTLLLLLALVREKPATPVRDRSIFFRLLLLFIPAYGSLVVITVAFFDAQTPFDERVFAPAFLAVMVTTVRLGLDLSRGNRSAVLAPIALTTLSLLFLLSHVERSAEWMEENYVSGFGYASVTWKESKVMKHLISLDGGVPIFTNGPDAVYILAGRPAFMIPSKVDPHSRAANTAYADQLGKMAAELKAKKGVLVYFDSISWRWYLPSETELTETLDLRAVARQRDGSIYQMNDGGTSEARVHKIHS